MPPPDDDVIYLCSLICNKYGYVNGKQILNILDAARNAFRNKNYDSIVLFYSGHGTQNDLY